jgi:hypothetical protein
MENRALKLENERLRCVRLARCWSCARHALSSAELGFRAAA